MTLALVPDILAKEEKTLSELMAELPQYSKIKDNIPCPNQLKEQVLEEMQKRVKAPKIDKLDGLKLYFPNQSWILIRPSGTEPKFRVYSEALSEKTARELIEKYRNLIHNIIESLS
jgi:phosphomannomutase/phosphoglucomutase